MVSSFDCWRCGTALENEPMPLGRESRCRVCDSDLHCCKLCSFYDRSKAKGCAEPVANEVRDKERANFCGYFTLNKAAFHANDQAGQAREALSALFGLSDSAESVSTSDPRSQIDTLRKQREAEAEAAKQALNKLFDVGDSDKE